MPHGTVAILWNHAEKYRSFKIQKNLIELNFSNLTAMRNAVSLIVAPYSLEMAPHFRGTYHFNLQDRRINKFHSYFAEPIQMDAICSSETSGSLRLQGVITQSTVPFRVNPSRNIYPSVWLFRSESKWKETTALTVVMRSYGTLWPCCGMGM
jgi:hypothetical protein